MSNFCGQCELFNNESEYCPFPGHLKDHAACQVFKLNKSVSKELSPDDFPIEASSIVIDMFNSNRDTSRAIDKMVKALIITCKNELCDPWDQINNEIEGFNEFNVKLISKGMCVTYDFLSKQLIVKTLDNQKT